MATMLSRLRKSFRRKSSHRRGSRPGHHDIEDDGYSDTGTLRSSQSSVRGSVSSLGSSASSAARRHHDPKDRRDTAKDPQWQRSTPSVIESNRVMFNRQLHCDVMFVVGEGGALVGAHRFVLVSRSDVLYRMFCGPLAETRPVVIPEVTEDVFHQFLEFLYVDEVLLTPKNVTPLHYLGRKYDVEPLVQQCLEFLHARLTCDNACSILEQAHCFDEHELYEASFEFVRENARECLASVAVHDLCRGCLERLLSEDALEVGEHALFKTALAWAEVSLEKKQEAIDASSVRQELGGLLHLIRFPAMTARVLRERVFPVGVLTPAEEKAVMGYKDRSRPTADPFVAQGRQRVLCRFQNTSRVRCSSQSAEWTAAITFTCDRDFMIHAISIFSCTREEQQANVRFSFLQLGEIDIYNRIPEYQHTHVFQRRVDALKTLTIPVNPPAPFLADVSYTLVLQANMAACFGGSDGMGTVVACDDVTFRFRDAQVKLNGTTVSEGQLPSFVFSVW
ncbi:BTB/POZ domain-containing protein 3-like [Babylonia areolata]|uniref:BTB/POZ domain-containing protein 3-like n=1 Tax=Babylonia areolata TaxID=304850 RepID=UPI003FD041E1